MKNLSVFTLFVTFVTLFFVLGCSGQRSDLVTELEQDLEAIRNELVPDRRVAVYNIIMDDERTAVTVETNLSEAAAATNALTNEKSTYGEILTVKELPDAELGEVLHGVVRVSVANLRRDPRHQAELIDQAVMGTHLKILKRQGGWYYIQTPWNYLGWVTGESFARMTAEEYESGWNSQDKVSVTAVDTRVFNEASLNSGVLSDVTLGGTVRLVRSNGSFTEVALPDGRTGFVQTAHIGPVKGIDNTTAPSGDRIVKSAARLHGLPYLWGGNSGKGLDCSGFTQTVFKDNGYLLPRDANMQVLLGEEVSIENDFADVQEGDLLFFGSNNRITHVGISLGGPKFIHASTYVMVNSLNPADEDYTEYRRNTLQVVKRIN